MKEKVEGEVSGCREANAERRMEAKTGGFGEFRLAPTLARKLRTCPIPLNAHRFPVGPP